jgi:hypothetical protein
MLLVMELSFHALVSRVRRIVAFKAGKFLDLLLFLNGCRSLCPGHQAFGSLK